MFLFLDSVFFIPKALKHFLPIFDPNNKKKIIWDFFIVLLLIIQLFWFTMEKSFKVELKEKDIFRDTDSFLLLLFIMD